MQESKITGLKKRQQIESAGRTMFIWVAIASVAISLCVVAVQFLYKQWEYNNKIYSAKVKAKDTLKSNIENIKKLQEEVNALAGNQNLSAVKTDPKDSNTKVVLDALPTTFDVAALATSLQQGILNKSGVTIESISVPGASDVEEPEEGAGDDQPVAQEFSIVVTGTYDKISNMLKDLERTIRPMQVKSVNLTGDDASLRATIDITTYYQPAKTVEIKKESIR